MAHSILKYLPDSPPVCCLLQTVFNCSLVICRERDPVICWKMIAIERYKREIMISPDLFSLLAASLTDKIKGAVTPEAKYRLGEYLDKTHKVCVAHSIATLLSFKVNDFIVLPQSS